MKVGIFNIEPKIHNTAYMQISAYYKATGSMIEWYNPNNDYDKIYASSLFSFTDKSVLPKETICGGSGFDLHSKLPQNIEDAQFDYSIYPSCETSYLWFSKGCNKKCPFCVVPQKEGNIHNISPRNLNPNGLHLSIMDNSFFANPNWREAIKYILCTRQKVKAFYGIDVFDLNEETISALLALKYVRQQNAIKIAWDNPRTDLEPKLKEIVRLIRPYRLMAYVLIGYWSTEEEDLYRVKTLSKYGIDPFVMPYDRNDLYQRNLARWCNHKAIFKSVAWKDYRRKA